MAERDSWAVGNSVVDQQDARMAIGALWTPGTSAIAAKTGFRPGPGSVTPGTVYASTTPDGFVHVQPFQGVLQTTRATPGGPFILTLDSVKDINVLSTPANATNPRNDLIIAHQSDTFYSDADSQLRVRQVVGTPSGTPSDPSLAAYPDAITLARVRVNANATTITGGNITDLRPSALYTVAVGGILPVATQAARDSLTGYYSGFAVWRQDREWVEVHDGTAWRVQGVPVVTSVGDLSAITHPQAGQIAYNTADDLFYRWSTTWRRQDWQNSWGVIDGRTWPLGNGTTSFGDGIGATELALTGFETTNVNLIGGRRYRLTAQTMVNRSATGQIMLRIRDTNVSGTVRGSLRSYDLTGNSTFTLTVAGRYDCAADETKIFCLTAQMLGAGTVDVRRDTAVPPYFEVEDMGPTANLTATA